MTLLQPKTVDIEGADGVTRAFVIGKFTAIAGREIITQYPISAMPKLGDYKVNEDLVVKVMAHVAVANDAGHETQLTTRALIDNHVPDWLCLMRLEAAVLEYNVGPFALGKASTFFAAIEAKAKALISQTLTEWSERSSAKGPPSSTS